MKIPDIEPYSITDVMFESTVYTNNLNNNILPVCMILIDLNASYISNLSTEIRHKFCNLSKKVLNFIISILCNQHFNPTRKIDLKIISNIISSDDLIIKLLTHDKTFKFRISKSTKVSSYKQFFGKAISSFGIGQNFTIINENRSEKYYSNYFLIAKYLSMEVIDPLAMLVTNRDNMLTINANILFDEEINTDLLEFWINEDFINSNSALYIYYRKIMYPILRDNNIKIVVKKRISIEFLSFCNKPNFSRLSDFLSYQQNIFSEFLSSEKLRLGVINEEIETTNKIEKSDLELFMSNIRIDY